MGLLENSGVLDVGYKVYFDNYYTSMDLMHELFPDTLLHVAQCVPTGKAFQ